MSTQDKQGIIAVASVMRVKQGEKCLARKSEPRGDKLLLDDISDKRRKHKGIGLLL